VSGRFDTDLTSGGTLDLWEASERALRRAGIDSVERLDLCTRCHPERFFSYRRTGPPHGAQGVIGALAG
jgi:copper oxidase (laccase) domain-containing protein